MSNTRRLSLFFCLVLVLSLLFAQSIFAVEVPIPDFSDMPDISGAPELDGEELTEYFDSILSVTDIASANAFLSTFEPVALFIIAGVGVMLAFFGYRLLKLAISLIGFAAGWTLASLAYDFLIEKGVLDATTLPEYMPLLISLAGGIIFSLIAFKLFKFGIFAASA